MEQPSTSVTIAYTGTNLTDLSWAAVYVSADGGPWTLFGWVWAASLTGSPPTGTITGSYAIGAGVTATVKLTYTLSAGAAHGRYVDGRVTTYTLTIPPAAGTDAPPIDPTGETRIDNTVPTVTVGIPAYLESGGNGVAEWTTDDKKYGSYSVGLTMPSADDYAEVWVPVSIPLGDLDLDGTSFWCKVTDGAWTPYFMFELETGGRINSDAFDSTGYTDWAEYVASDSPQWQWPDGTWHSWEDTKTEFGENTLITKVLVELSGIAGPITAYVDDITVTEGSSLLFPLDQVLRGGADYYITWIATDDDDFTLDDDLSINLEYSPDGGDTWILIANDGEYLWTLPTINSNEVLVRATAFDLAGNSGSDVSDEFTIDSTAPTISELTPADGAYVNTKRPWINATLTNGLSGIDRNSITMTVNENPIITYQYDETTGLLSYTPTADLPQGLNNVTVSVKDKAGNGPTTASWSFIVDTIAPTILATTLIYPNGGESFFGGQTVNILWNATQITDVNLGTTPISLYYSTNGTTWVLIKANEANDGSYTWKVPSVDSTTVKVKITATDLAGNSAFDTSDGNFTIVTPVASVNVTAFPLTVQADGVSTSMITALVLDQYGNPIVGRTVYFITTLGTLSAPSAVTGPEGKATVTATADSKSDNVDVVFVKLIIDWLVDIKSEITAIEGKLDNPTYGLAAIKAAIDAIDVSGIETMLSDIEAKLDAGGSFYTFVNTWFTTIDTEIDAIKAVTDTINWADITAIKTEIGDISADSGRASWTTLGVALDDIKTEIEEITIDFTSVLNAISGLDAKLGTFTGNDNVASLLYDISDKLDAITAGAQATSGSGTTTADKIIYTNSKVGTVTVSISTTGIGFGENVRVRYYINPATPTLYIQKTVTSNTNTAGWTDTAAAWQVYIDITGTVNYAYSVIYPP